jgi:fission 1 protein
VQACRDDYAAAFAVGGRGVEAARARLVWALVHSASGDADVERGLAIATEAAARAEAAGPGPGSAADEAAAAQASREMAFLRAVAHYRLGRSLEARSGLRAVLEREPASRQAEALLAAVEERLVRDGLLGLGIGLGAAAVGLALLFRRR